MPQEIENWTSYSVELLNHLTYSQMLHNVIYKLQDIINLKYIVKCPFNAVDSRKILQRVFRGSGSVDSLRYRSWVKSHCNSSFFQATNGSVVLSTNSE